MISLPNIMNSSNKIVVAIICGIIATFVYMVPNHYPIFTPQYLSMLWIDQIFPFLPWTVWIYSSEYFLFYSAYFICKDDQNINKFLYAFMTLQIFSSIVFLLYPTTFPRDLFPLVDDGSMTFRFFNHLRTVDAPTNCFPSLHVSSCYLTSFMFLDEKKKLFPLYFGWATAIAICTLTTKQHYIIDVIAGLIVAYGLYWIFHHKAKYYQPKWWYTSSKVKYSKIDK